MSGLVLHNYFRSSTSIRVRAALNLKGLSYDYVAHHLRKGEQRSEAYLNVNPQGLVPAQDGRRQGQECESLPVHRVLPPRVQGCHRSWVRV